MDQNVCILLKLMLCSKLTNLPFTAILLKSQDGGSTIRIWVYTKALKCRKRNSGLATTQRQKQEAGKNEISHQIQWLARRDPTNPIGQLVSVISVAMLTRAGIFAAKSPLKVKCCLRS